MSKNTLTHLGIGIFCWVFIFAIGSGCMTVRAPDGTTTTRVDTEAVSLAIDRLDETILLVSGALDDAERAIATYKEIAALWEELGKDIPERIVDALVDKAKDASRLRANLEELMEARASGPP